MTIDITIQIAGIIITLLGLLLIWYQIKSSQRDTLVSSLLSAVAEHWMLYEERRMQIRSGETKVYYPHVLSHLEELLSIQYQGNLRALAEDFLPTSKIEEVVAEGRNAVLDTIVQEYAVLDLYFNLCEEEFLAGRYLQLTSQKMWDYWDTYIRENFRSELHQNHWRLRRDVGKTFPKFAEFVEQNYLPKH